MTTLSIGSSATVTVGDGGVVSIATNGGSASVIVTPTVGSAQTYSIGPQPWRQKLGPFAEGASVSLTNSTCGFFDYDYSGPILTTAQAAAVAAAFPLGSAGVLVEATPYTQKTATGTAFSGACEYAGYDVVSVVASPTLTVYDGTDTSGALILPATTLTVGRFERTFKLALTTGCHVVISGTATVNVLVG